MAMPASSAPRTTPAPALLMLLSLFQLWCYKFTFIVLSISCAESFTPCTHSLVPITTGTTGNNVSTASVNSVNSAHALYSINARNIRNNRRRQWASSCHRTIVFGQNQFQYRPWRIRRMASLSVKSGEFNEDEVVDLCIIGGGVSGLAAAITAAESATSTSRSKESLSSSISAPSILLLESQSKLGGRVQSELTPDGFTLDRGFAVFIEEYPTSKTLFNYDSLGLKRFWPGARVKLPHPNDSGANSLAAVSDPLRRPQDLIQAITSPVGTPMDKLRLIPLFYNVFTKSIPELFEMDKTDTLTCLRSTYHFSNQFISSFFAPFLEGIYLTPLENQSSDMFHLVMKMFTVGSVSLPRRGMQGVVDQLADRAEGRGKLERTGRAEVIDRAVEAEGASGAGSDRVGEGGGVDIRTNSKVLSLHSHNDSFSLEVLVPIVSSDSTKLKSTTQRIHAKSVVLATDERIARQLLTSNYTNDPNSANIPEQIKALPKMTHRKVGCLYFSLPSPAPLLEPILILNGEGVENGGRRNTKEFPVNNVCFPSVVYGRDDQHERDDGEDKGEVAGWGYAPVGYELCSVTILENALNGYFGNDKRHELNELDEPAIQELDKAVRNQLSKWFPSHSEDILDSNVWVRKGVYVIDNAQPAHYSRFESEIPIVDNGTNGANVANVHGGRNPSTFRGIALPKGMFACGDYMATSTLNGALESGVNAGNAAVEFLNT